MSASSFMKTSFSPRTKKLVFPVLQEWFGDSYEVRGLTAEELARANEASDKNKNISSIIEAMNSVVSEKDKLEKLKESLGVGSGNIPQDTAKRLEHLVLGSVNPKIKLDVAVKLSTVYPIEFFQITTEILKLTGLGQTFKKK